MNVLNIEAKADKDEKKKDTSLLKVLHDNHVVWLDSGVNEKNMMEITTQMLVLSAKDPKKDIVLLINSPGGSVTAGVMLYDVMQSIPNDVVTVALGMAASMGQFLLTTGAPGKRYIAKNARVLLHQPLGGYHGTSTSIEIEAALINSMKDQLAGITAERTGKTIEQIHKDGDHDNWFTAAEAVEYGFADHIIEDITSILALTIKDEV